MTLPAWGKFFLREASFEMFQVFGERVEENSAGEALL